MENVGDLQPDYQAAIRAWELRAPLVRRILARIGLPGKLIAAFLGLLLVGLGGSCWLFLHESREILGLSLHRAATEATLHRAEIAILACSAVAAFLAVPVVILV